MSQTDRVEMHFSGGDQAPELDDYRPISPLVIAACIAGVLSLLAVVHPLLWFVPVVAIILAVCAIRQVSSKQSRYSGRLAALAALCLALLIGSYAPARALSLERALYDRGAEQVKTWISLIQQGRSQEAHQVTLGLHGRFQGPGRLAEHYRPATLTPSGSASQAPTSMEDAAMIMQPTGSDQLETFLQDPIIAKLIEFGEQGSVALVQNSSIRTARGNVEVTQRFRVSGMHDGQPESIDFFVTATRWKVRGHANWQVNNYREPLE